MDLTSQSPKLLRILAIAALALGFFAIFAGSPSRTTVTLDVLELASIIEREEDHVSPEQLASMIMNPAGTFRLIDVRDSVSHAVYHIPGAEHWDLTALASVRFKPLETLVLYSQGGTHASQAWFLLKARGLRNVYTVRGGLDLWNARVLYPEPPTGASRAAKDSLHYIAAFFGGFLTDRPPVSRKTPASDHSHQNRLRFERERERTRDGC